MRLGIYSDLHNEFSTFKPPALDVDAVVFAGDIDVNGRAIRWMADAFPDVAKIYVAGNHEFYGQHVDKMRRQLRDEAQAAGIHFLDDGEAVIGGVRFLGATLWTDYALESPARQPLAMWDAQQGLNDHRKIRTDGYRKFLPQDALALHARSVAFLRGKLAEPFGGKTVVVTHHAPSPNSIHPRFAGSNLNACYASNLERLMGPDADLWIHGHVHDAFDYAVNGTRVVANPRGYQFKNDPAPENANFNPALVVTL